MKIRKLDHHVVHLAPDPPPKTEAWELNGKKYRSLIVARRREPTRYGRDVIILEPVLTRCGAKLRGRVIVVPSRTAITCPACRRI